MGPAAGTTTKVGLREFGDEVARAITRFDVSARVPNRFRGEVRRRRVAGMGLCELSAEPCVAYRPPDPADATELLYMVSLQLEGEARVEQDGLTAVMRPGDIGVNVSTRASAVIAGERYHSLCLTVPAQLIDVPADYLHDDAVFIVPSERGLAPALSALLVSLNKSIDNVASIHRPRAMRGALDLTVAFLLNEFGDRAATSIDPVTRMRERMLRYIDNQLPDPELGVQQLASAHFVSTRYVHNIFRGTGDTAAVRIRRRRMDRVCRDLADPLQLGTPVAAIAARWGFVNASHFGHLFKSSTGLTPADYRRRSTEN